MIVCWAGKLEKKMGVSADTGPFLFTVDSDSFYWYRASSWFFSRWWFQLPVPPPTVAKGNKCAFLLGSHHSWPSSSLHPWNFRLIGSCKDKWTWGGEGVDIAEIWGLCQNVAVNIVPVSSQFGFQFTEPWTLQTNLLYFGRKCQALW